MPDFIHRALVWAHLKEERAVAALRGAALIDSVVGIVVHAVSDLEKGAEHLISEIRDHNEEITRVTSLADAAATKLAQGQALTANLKKLLGT